VEKLSMSEIATLEEVGSESVVVAPKRSKRRLTGSRPKRQPPYAVVVHNDSEHTFPYVIELLQRVCSHSRAAAYLLTCQIHFTGRARVWSGAREVAELKCDQIRGYGPDLFAEKPVSFPLGVTLEPLPVD
jgi:ATP-dependent Clp protease adaptor protein ClpS